jgi:hypothetical protein
MIVNEFLLYKSLLTTLSVMVAKVLTPITVNMLDFLEYVYGVPERSLPQILYSISLVERL